MNIHEAKSRLSQLLERALNGEDVVIARAGKPIARLVAIRNAPKRTFGSAAGTVHFGEGWDEPLTDAELTEFLG